MLLKKLFYSYPNTNKSFLKILFNKVLLTKTN